jgi:hypothetical protein
MGHVGKATLCLLDVFINDMLECRSMLGVNSTR